MIFGYFDPGMMLAFMGACLVLYLTPGADMMFTIASGAAGGPKAGLAAAAGIITGVCAHVLLAAAGMAALIATQPVLYDAIRYAGAAYLLFLAVQMWRSAPGMETGKGAASVKRAFRRGFITNILNPKVALFVVAFLPQFVDPSRGSVGAQVLILGGVLALGGLVTDGLYGVAAGYAAARVRRIGGVMNKVAAIIFGGLAVRIATG